MKCQNNLKQIAIAIHSFESSYGRFPFGTSGCCTIPGPNWTVEIMPFAEQTNLVNSLTLTPSDGLKNSANATAVKQIIPMFICPTDPASASPIMTRYAHNASPALALWYPASMGPTHMDDCPFCPAGASPSPGNYCCQGYNFGTQAGAGYPAGSFAGIFGRTNATTVRISNVTDGLSGTFLVGETLPGDCTFMGVFSQNFPVTATSIPLNTFEAAVDSNWFRTCGFKSKHTGGANFAMGDGSVRFVSTTINYQIYNGVGTRAGGEVASLD